MQGLGLMGLRLYGLIQFWGCLGFRVLVFRGLGFWELLSKTSNLQPYRMSRFVTPVFRVPDVLLKGWVLFLEPNPGAQAPGFRV